MKLSLRISLFIVLIVPAFAMAQIPQLDQFNLEALEGFTGGQDATFNPVSIGQMGASNNFTINTVPQYPGPNTETTVLVEAYSLNTAGAEIVWFVDGIELAEARNLREATVTTRGVGVPTEIRVEIRMTSGQRAVQTITLNPRQVDLIIEADTMTPDFYEGRALPSVGSTVRLVAIPDDSDGRRPADYTYIWKLNNDVLFGGSITGRYAVDVVMGIDRNQLVTVDVIDPRGFTVARKSIYVPLSEPEVHFYEDNPLRGGSELALQSPFILTKDEVTLRAEPYYMSNNLFQTDHLLEWELNSGPINNPNQDRQFITLRRQTNAGAAQLGFQARNLEQLLQGVKGELTISY